MDPLSAATGIPAICITCTQLMLSFYQYIDDVREVPRHVEELTRELSSLNTALTRLKVLIETCQNSHRSFLVQWADDAKRMLENCRETLGQIEDMVSKAKIETKSSSKGQLIKCMKWLWNKNEVILLTKRIERYKSVISMALQTLSSEQLDNATGVLEKLHKSMEKLQEERQHVKETLVVMDKDHPRFQEANFTVTYNPVQPEQFLPNPSSPSSDFRQLNARLLDSIRQRSWEPRVIKCSSKWKDVPLLLKPSIKILLRTGKIACLEISLPDQDKNNFQKLYSEHLEKTRAELETRIPRPPSMATTIVNIWDKAPWWQKAIIASSPTSYVAGGAVLMLSTMQNATTQQTHQHLINQKLGDAWEAGPFPLFFRTFRNSTVFFEVAFCNIIRKNQYGIQIAPAAHTHPHRKEYGSLDIEFDLSSDADDFFQLLLSVKNELEHSWKMHVRSFANIDRELQASTPDDLVGSAVQEEYKWGTYLRACID